MRRPGIHVRLVLAAILLISATTFALSHMGGNIAYRFIQLRFEERMLFLARYLALNAELGILIDDQKMLRRLAENLLAEKDVVRVEIFNDRNEMLTEVTKGKGGKTSEVEVPVNLKKANSFPWGMVRKPESQVVGRVRIVYSTEGIDALLEVMRTRFLWLSVGLAAVAVGIFYFISRSLVAPVTRLVHASRQVASGDLALRVRPGTLPETRELAIAFNAMLDSLERNRQALEDAHLQMIRQEMLAQKGKFSLMIAHEFKNPLGIIKCSLDILKKDIECPENNLMIVYIEDEIRRLNQLIEDFLVFARPAVPNFREVDFSAVLRENVERFEIQLNGTPVKICTEIPSVACAGYADPDLLTRVICNILKNAVEANENQGEIRVRSFCREQTWVMEISDQGAGIAAENVQKIFEPFFTTRSRGTGLGLAFVAQVVAEHGGNITAENQETGGARFILELPLDRDLSDGETI